MMKPYPNSSSHSPGGKIFGGRSPKENAFKFAIIDELAACYPSAATPHLVLKALIIIIIMILMCLFLIESLPFFGLLKSF
jgi:hypothetical protein